MKLSGELRSKFIDGWISGALVGIGLFALLIVTEAPSMIDVDDINTFYYLGFISMILGVIFGAYNLSTIHKIVDRVKSNETSIE